ncbi:PHP domain-containing protein [Candidatus Woesearchaeota archaeon]|nr:PHP domain-containing protein [Candidatus Woesearchaeota archaeon]
MLKADFHIHTREDSKDDWIKYNAKDLINHASKLGFEVLAITNHGIFTYNEELAKYAKEKGILLIPGIEAYIKGKHTIILNATKEAEEIKTFSELRDYKKKNTMAFVMAPHPFYPYFHCLNKNLLKNIDVFDSIEYCHYYCRLHNPYNKKAVETAKKFNKPLIGSSDTHRFFQFNKTYSLVDADKNLDSVIKALRENKIKIKTEPLSYFNCMRTIVPMIKNKIRRLFLLEKFK